MADVANILEQYIESTISLQQSDISSAAASREWLLTRIENEITKRSQGPQLHPDRFLFYGSYFKRTKVSNVDEFDLLVVLDSNGGVFRSNGVEKGHGLGRANPNNKYSPPMLKADGTGLSPKKLLEWLRDIAKAVADTNGGALPRKDGPAVTIELKSKGIKVDLVPAGIFKRPDSADIFYNIPKGDSEDWTLTSPQIDMDRLAEIAEGRSNFRNVIRVLKRLRDVYQGSVSSFALETLVVDFGEKFKWENNLSTDLCNVLSYASAAFLQGSVFDPFDNKNLIQGCENLEVYARLFSSVRKLLIDAAFRQHTSALENTIINALENRR